MTMATARRLSEVSVQLELGVSPLFNEPLQRLQREVIERAPVWGAALGSFLLLWLAARVARAVVGRLLGMSKLDRVIGDTLMGRILAGLGEGMTASKAIAALVYVVGMLLAILSAADILALTAMKSAVYGVLSYLPRLGSGAAVLAIGSYVARSARRAVGVVMKELRSPYAGIAESLTEGVLMLVTVTVAVNVLGADLSFVTSNLAVILGTVAVTAAFLFGWSMRRPAEEIIANYYLRRLVRVGDRVTLASVEGIVDRFAALGLVLKDEAGAEHFVPARHILGGLQRTKGSPLARPGG